MNLEKLQNLIHKEKIELVNCNMHDTKARIIQDNKNSFIFINRKQIENTTEEKCILAEEMGHYYCDALYSPLYYDKQLVDKNEYRANKWAFKTLISKNKLKKLSKKGYANCEIAEELGVTEDLLNKAYNYYFNN